MFDNHDCTADVPLHVPTKIRLSVGTPNGVSAANDDPIHLSKIINPRRRCYLYAILLLILAACSPPQTPEQLNFTPGAPITITDDLYVTGAFSVRYPPGWRVITTPAEAPPGAIFAAPDNAALIVLSISPIGTPPELANVPAERVAVEGDEVVLENVTVHAMLIADRDAINTLKDDFTLVIESIKAE